MRHLLTIWLMIMGVKALTEVFTTRADCLSRSLMRELYIGNKSTTNEGKPCLDWKYAATKTTELGLGKIINIGEGNKCTSVAFQVCTSKLDFITTESERSFCETQSVQGPWCFTEHSGWDKSGKSSMVYLSECFFACEDLDRPPSCIGRTFASHWWTRARRETINNSQALIPREGPAMSFYMGRANKFYDRFGQKQRCYSWHRLYYETQGDKRQIYTGYSTFCRNLPFGPSRFGPACPGLVRGGRSFMLQPCFEICEIYHQKCRGMGGIEFRNQVGPFRPNPRSYADTYANLSACYNRISGCENEYWFNEAPANAKDKIFDNEYDESCNTSKLNYDCLQMCPSSCSNSTCVFDNIIAGLEDVYCLSDDVYAKILRQLLQIDTDNGMIAKFPYQRGAPDAQGPRAYLIPENFTAINNIIYFPKTISISGKKCMKHTEIRFSAHKDQVAGFTRYYEIKAACQIRMDWRTRSDRFIYNNTYYFPTSSFSQIPACIVGLHRYISVNPQIDHKLLHIPVWENCYTLCSHEQITCVSSLHLQQHPLAPASASNLAESQRFLFEFLRHPDRIRHWIRNVGNLALQTPYSGSRNFTLSGKECLSWAEVAKIFLNSAKKFSIEKGIGIYTVLFHFGGIVLPWYFHRPGNQCFNGKRIAFVNVHTGGEGMKYPTIQEFWMDGGPWCYTRGAKNSTLQWEYCFPQCDAMLRNVDNQPKDQCVSRQSMVMLERLRKNEHPMPTASSKRSPCKVVFNGLKEQHLFMANVPRSRSFGIDVLYGDIVSDTIHRRTWPEDWTDSLACPVTAEITLLHPCWNYEWAIIANEITKPPNECMNIDLLDPDKFLFKLDANGSKYEHSHVRGGVDKTYIPSAEGVPIYGREGKSCAVPNPKHLMGRSWVSVTSNPSKHNPIITCRLAGDKMMWYRGMKSVTFRGKLCQLWLSQTPNAHNFTDSMKYFKERKLSDVSNFCRNPDKSDCGPWCFVSENGSLVREACFYDCNYPKNISNAGEKYNLHCVPKSNWPWNMADCVDEFCSNLYGQTHKRINDLGDLLTAPSTVKNIEAGSSFSIGDKFNFGIMNQCFQTGLMASLLGPWGYVKRMPSAKVRPLPCINEHTMELGCWWTPCFYACEDVHITCIPRHELATFMYGGPKTTSVDGKECLNWHEVAFKYDSLLKKHPVYTEIFYDQLKNYHIARLHSNRCINFNGLLDLNKISSKVNPDMLLGPVCFVKFGDVLKLEPCLKACEDDYLEELNCVPPVNVTVPSGQSQPGYIYTGRFNLKGRCRMWAERTKASHIPWEIGDLGHNYCRNPMGEQGGPWCLVDGGDWENGKVTKQFCFPKCTQKQLSDINLKKKESVLKVPYECPDPVPDPYSIVDLT